MLHFDNNKPEKKEFDLIEEGKYETILNAEWRKTANGDLYINCTFRIRKDVEQKNGGRLVFDGIYKSRNNGEYSKAKIDALLSTIENAKCDFESYDELIQYLNNRNMIITIETQKADPSYPNSKDKSVVKYLSYEPTKYPNNAVKAGSNLPEVDDSLLPF